MPAWLKLDQIAAAGVYSVCGSLLLVGLFTLTDKLTPGSLWKEIMEEHNNAVAILFGAWAIAIGIIIAASIHG
ncbi:MAG: DUF350 domain-containing protein [Planctomycetes bacterium]|nr:DUF350 domain-containing protein [Planctomycetota bacterium]